jgi:ComF family protein
MPIFFGMEDYDYIIPVPNHKKRDRNRGYNPLKLVVRRLSYAVNIPVETRILTKIVDNESQTRQKSVAERLKNVKGVFDISNPSGLIGKRILLVDDVFTSGATVNESSRMLIKKGKVRYVDVFTLARQVRSD